MDPLVQVAIIGGVVTVVAAWIARPTQRTRRSVRRIEGQFENNGGSSAKDAWDRIEQSQERLIGRFDEHVRQSDADKAAAHAEALQMWSAIRAVANSTPPPEGEPRG